VSTAVFDNLELKARDPDPTATLVAARAAGAVDRGLVEQRDVFFWLPVGRLKLRRQGDEAELIHYSRPDLTQPAPSRVRRVPLADPEHTEEQLDAYLGATVVVEKRRRLLTKDNVRIHLDDVSGLGRFVELEAVAPPGMRPEGQLGAINALRRTLGITDERLLPSAYVDYLKAAGRTGERQ
jgi:adenylate cyclase class 2